MQRTLKLGTAAGATKTLRDLRGMALIAAAMVLLEMTMVPSAKAGSRLAPCPDSPNCVSSLASRQRQAVDPFPLRGSGAESIECLSRIVSTMKRARVVAAEPGFLHAEFRTALGFVDDVTFEVDPGQDAIHLRSASRIGYWDLGVNRRRIERIRAAFEEFCR